MGIRCRYYEDDGDPIRGGCRRQGNGCGFIHPSEPGWSSAIPANKNAPFGGRGGDPSFSRGGGRGRGRGRGAPGGGSFTDHHIGQAPATDDSNTAFSGWGAPPSAPSAPRSQKTSQSESAWDTSSWGVQSSAAPESKGGQSPGGWGSSGDSGWGGRSSSKGSAPSVGGWGGASPDAKNGSDGGGLRNADGGWATADNDSSGGGWGPSSGGGNGWSGGGWGSGDGASGNDTSGGWGGSTNEASDKKDGDRVPPVTDKGAVGSRSDSKGHSSRSKDPQESHPNEVNNNSWSAEKEPIVLNTVKDLPHTQGTHDSGSRATSPAVQTAEQLPQLTPALDKTDSRTKVIQSMCDAVRIKMELDELQRDCDRWKVTQTSPQFGHIGISARDKLNNIRAEYDKKLFDSKQTFSNTTLFLSEFPEIPRLSPGDFHPEVDEAALVQYTQELREWVGGIRKHLIMASAPPKSHTIQTHREGNSPPTKRQRLDLSEDEAHMSSPQSEFVGRLYDLEHRLDETLEQLEETKNSCSYNDFPDTVEKKLEITLAKEKEELAQVPGVLGQVHEFMQEANALGDKLGEQAEKTATVLLIIHGHEQRLKDIAAKDNELKLRKERFQERMVRLEKAHHEDSEQIRQISEQIQNLHNHPPQTRQTPSFTAEDLIPHLELTVREVLRTDVEPILGTIREDCSAQLQKFSSQIHTTVWKKLQPTFALVEGIYPHIESQDT